MKLSKLLNLSEPLLIHLHMGMLSLLCCMKDRFLPMHSLMSFWQSLMREAGISCKVESKNHSIAGLSDIGIRFQGMNVWIFPLVPIIHMTTISKSSFLSLLPFPL